MCDSQSRPKSNNYSINPLIWYLKCDFRKALFVIIIIFRFFITKLFKKLCIVQRVDCIHSFKKDKSIHNSLYFKKSVMLHSTHTHSHSLSKIPKINIFFEENFLKKNLRWFQTSRQSSKPTCKYIYDCKSFPLFRALCDIWDDFFWKKNRAFDLLFHFFTPTKNML